MEFQKLFSRFRAISIVLLVNFSFAYAAEPFITGGDVSMLPAIEKAGGVFRESGKPGDALQIMRGHGCNLFRVRLFVHPNPDFMKSDGAIQDLDYVKALAKRIKASGAEFLLDIHYSDTWADPGKQFTPQAWEGLDFEALRHRMHDYTVSVLKDLQANGTPPDMVQIGNEITAGVLWPQGKVLDAPPETEQLQWRRFSQLENSAAAAVRESQSDSHKIRIIIHIHGGGKEGLPKWFFQKLNQNPVDYDIIGLSFYPAWDDSIDALKQNMSDVIELYGKDVLLAETSYPWREMDGIRQNKAMQWPMTREGQAKFLNDLAATMRAAPGGHGIGFVWWYPDAIPVGDLHIWRNGAEALFDETGNALPALDAFGAGKQ
ncbi:MAG TPA: glycosyl hydrolase 53 family protein [Tepidisphaeraceae bacterium]|nr:glycosyl hydrolase 53 family protein [Tepidisphaeraceae bacterium]